MTKRYEKKEIKGNVVFRFIMIFVVIVCFMPIVFSQSSDPEIVGVDLCDLIREPDRYDGKKIRVVATYRYGFEWSEIYCSSCWHRDEGRIWVDFDDAFEDTTSKRIRRLLKSNSESGRTLLMTAVGRFSKSPSRYNHENEYTFAFVVEKVEKATKIFDGSPVPSALDEKEMKLADCKH